MAITPQQRQPLGFWEALVGDGQGEGLIEVSVLDPGINNVEPQGNADGDSLTTSARIQHRL